MNAPANAAATLHANAGFAAPMLSTDEALERLLSAAMALQTFETLELEAASGRILAHALVSGLDVPGRDVSAMDGYAVRCAELGDATPQQPRRLPVSQRIPAGSVGGPLGAATVARIFTGAPLPAGADAVVIQEDVHSDGAWAEFSAAPTVGAWVNRRGADIAAGSTVLPAGTRLTPQALGLAASLGFARLEVVKRPRVAFFSTGDELTHPGQPLREGAIYNSNRYVLGAWLERFGCEVVDYGVVPDRFDATTEALRAAARDADLVLTCGGVSVGEEDHVKAAVEAEGRLDLWKIAVKPGKPLAFGRLKRATQAGAGDGAYFIGLPGNPVSAFVTTLIFVRPFLLRLMGVTDVRPARYPLRADFDWPGDRRNEFLRVRVGAEGGLALYPTQSSAVLSSTVWGEGLVDNPPGQAIARGDVVSFIPFAALLG